VSRTTGIEYTTTVIEAIGIEHKETTRWDRCLFLKEVCPTTQSHTFSNDDVLFLRELLMLWMYLPETSIF
jgi:hypothetical protein